MKGMLVYHGGTVIVEHPLCRFGRDNLDFGQGFYVTDIRQQAVDWAMNVANRRKEKPLLNRYRLFRDSIIANARTLIFDAYDINWLEFVVANRQGKNMSKDYDYIEGGVANDRVIDTVNLYLAGLMTQETALARLSEHKPNNQICLLNQSLTDKYLIFDGTECIE
ncbi:MAG: DUF3990 domain-containing protein [Prevotella sp.]|nr:DUF3990 domain-containing protein [Prevotella sp.]